jgi:hypothetical protein
MVYYSIQKRTMANKRYPVGCFMTLPASVTKMSVDSDPTTSADSDSDDLHLHDLLIYKMLEDDVMFDEN